MKGFKFKVKTKTKSGSKTKGGGFFGFIDGLFGYEEPKYNLTKEDVEELMKLINEDEE